MIPCTMVSSLRYPTGDYPEYIQQMARIRSSSTADHLGFGIVRLKRIPLSHRPITRG